MDAKTIIDNAIRITARQDLDPRPLMLQFLNTVRRTILREKTIRKFFDYRTVIHTNGLIDSSGIKFARTIEYINADNSVIKLYKLKGIDDARSKELSDFAITGTPAYYLDYGTKIQVLPVPTDGELKIYGEFWPVDLTDSVSSSDVITDELPDALIYLTAAEYLEFFDENEKGMLWRKKGLTIVEEYVKQDKKQALYGLGLSSDPLGNGGLSTRKSESASSSISGYDPGEW